MPFETVTGVTGSGLHTFSSFYTPIGVYIDVTSLGEAIPMDLGPPVRYLHIGWFALVDTDPDVGAGIVGDFIHRPLFIDYAKAWLEDRLQQDALTAATGFTWNLRTGVVADFFFY